MGKVRLRGLLAAVICLLLGLVGHRGAGAADYASKETRKIVERMLAAHGGLAAWQDAPAVSFHAHLKVNFGNDNWVPYWEEVTADPRTRRVYAKLPNPDGTFGRIAYDGVTAWSAGELRGIAGAPARFTAWRNFYLFNLPWLTQDAGVLLGESTRAHLPSDTTQYWAIEMSFASGVGDTPNDHYTLFIDPDTYRLRAAEYVMTYASMLGEGETAGPPSIFVWEETSTVSGLVVPSRYTVYWSADHSVAVKDGTITHWSFERPFEERWLEMPTDGVVDRSRPAREGRETNSG